MLARKLIWTGVLVLSYVVIATAADYLVNIIVLRTPQAFSPAETALLAVLIGAPATFYFLNQRMDLRRAIADRDTASAILRQKTRELATSEERYRLLADQSPDVIVRYDVDGRVEYLSPAARKYGWDTGRLEGANVSASLDPSELERNRRFLNDLAEGRAVPQGEQNVWRARTADGRSVCFEGRSSPIRAPDGKVLGAVAILRDITERRLAEAALRESEQKLRSLFELAPVGIALTDSSGRYAEFNGAFREICGYPDGELRALDYRRQTSPGYEEADAARRESLAATGRYGPYEKEFVRKDGSRVPVRVSGMLLEGADGEQFVWSIVEDIAERQRTEQVLIEARNAAESATVAKSNFLSNMSHEIRTPLTSVVGFAGLLKSMQALPSEARRYADRIAMSAEALLAIVNDVLDFSRLEAGQMELDPQPFDPAEFIETAVDLLRDRAAGKGLALTVRIESAVPPHLLADSARLRQVLFNLLSNAIKFTDCGSVAVVAGYVLEMRRLRVEVRDTGIGVPPDVAPRLFQRFSQADASSSRAYGGAGLGLAITRSLVEMMQGDIGFASKPGEGSTFWFEIPAPVADRTEAPGEADAPADAGAALGRLTLLVVDDVAVNRELVLTMLSPFDVTTFEAASGPEAIAMALRQRFDVILMDLQMPGMDGMAATRAIRAGSEPNRATPILALSANVLPEQVAACVAAGMDDHIAKPIRPAELIGKIGKWTAGRRSMAMAS